MINDETLIPVNEVFRTFQGEGDFIGMDSIFLRLQGCNMKCEWCDQADSIPMKYRKDFEVTLKTLKNRIEGSLTTAQPRGQRILVITGGEPMVFQKLYPLARALWAAFHFQKVVIETNGTVAPEQLKHFDEFRGFIRSNMVFSVAPKREDFALTDWLGVKMYLKVTTDASKEFDRVNQNTLKKAASLRDIRVYVQPCDSDFEDPTGVPQEDLWNAMEKFHEWQRMYPELDLRMGIQAHKFWQVQ